MMEARCGRGGNLNYNNVRLQCFVETPAASGDLWRRRKLKLERALLQDECPGSERRGLGIDY